MQIPMEPSVPHPTPQAESGSPGLTPLEGWLPDLLSVIRRRGRRDRFRARYSIAERALDARGQRAANKDGAASGRFLYRLYSRGCGGIMAGNVGMVPSGRAGWATGKGRSKRGGK
jgi:hypothetical protein